SLWSAAARLPLLRSIPRSQSPRYITTQDSLRVPHPRFLRLDSYALSPPLLLSSLFLLAHLLSYFFQLSLSTHSPPGGSLVSKEIRASAPIFLYALCDETLPVPRSRPSLPLSLFLLARARLVPHRHRHRAGETSHRRLRLRSQIRHRPVSLHALHLRRPRRSRLLRYSRTRQPQLLSHQSAFPTRRTPDARLVPASRQRQFPRLRQSHRILRRSRHLCLDVRRSQHLQPDCRRQGLSRRSHRRQRPQIRPPIRRRNHQQTFRRTRQHRLHADRLHSRHLRLQGTLGHGLRWRQSTQAHLPRLRCAHPALVARRFTHRLHL